MKRLINRIDILKKLYNFFFNYPVSLNLSYARNFGVYASVFSVIQICTGIFSAMYYIPELNYAFASVEYIMREVQYGWVVRYMHANGASMFFTVVYIHMFRGIYYTPYNSPRGKVWISGVIIFILMIVTAFLGYVLPWGQMSFWAATVITNLLSAVPEIGSDLVIWLWGAYSVDSATLNRFYSFHSVSPFSIMSLVIIHLMELHEVGSNNPKGIGFKHIDHTTMYPYYIVKDIFGIFILLLIFICFVFFAPNVLGHVDNYVTANPLMTPKHIVPEWYFSPFYAILRAIPNKLLGVIIMLSSILILLILPLMNQKPKVRSMTKRPLSLIFFFLFIITCLLLGYIGSCPAISPYIEIGKILTVFYSSYLGILLPLMIFFENRYNLIIRSTYWKIFMREFERMQVLYDIKLKKYK